MKTESRTKALLLSLYRYLGFFLFMAFIISCCMMLFLRALSETMGLAYSAESIRPAAVLTAGNVILLSLICTAVDAIRRKWTVDRPVQEIVQAAGRLMAGDFSVRIPTHGGSGLESGFRQIAECFNRMAEELSGMETLRTDFIANVSHELKTPLAVMQNYGVLLQQPGLSEEQRVEYARELTLTCQRLASLITNILKLNRLENQQIFPEVQTYDLGEQLCQCLLGFEGVWEEKKLEIETDIGENILVCQDPELLSLVWNNLFSNALKFTERGGSVSVSLTTEGDFAVVRVTDTGCGISREVGRHMFEKFYQGDTSHAAQGNGLGLALVKRIIDIVQGEISVSSEVGRGSTFAVRLERERHEAG